MTVSLSRMKQRASTVHELIEKVSYEVESENMEDLENNYELLYSDVLEMVETLDIVLSDFKK